MKNLFLGLTLLASSVLFANVNKKPSLKTNKVAVTNCYKYVTDYGGKIHKIQVKCPREIILQ